MTIEMIRAFLAVAEYGNISSAAQHLYAAQSNITKRIQLLEEEIGAPLIVRSRGVRKIELTGYGEQFLAAAKQIDTLWNDTETIGSQNIRLPLSIGGIDLMNNYTFVPFYREFIKKHPELSLSVHTYHSSELHTKVSTHGIDLGYVFSDLVYTDVIATPLYKEKMYLVTKQNIDPSEMIDISSLDPAKEIYLRWSAAFETWHNYHFKKRSYMLRVGTGSMIPDFMQENGNWAIVPSSLAHYLEDHDGLVRAELTDAPPERICYQLEHRYPRENRMEGMNCFKQEMAEYIRTSNSVIPMF